MKLLVRLFAQLREAAGSELLELSAPRTVDVEGLLEILRDEQPGLAALLADGAFEFRVAVNLEIAPRDRPLRDGDEVALIPPVGGG